MQTTRLIALCLLPLLAPGCAALRPGPTRPVALNCRNFHRTFDGGWQPDGAGTARVNGQRVSLGEREFTASGPDLLGVRMYPQIEAQCGALQLAATP